MRARAPEESFVASSNAVRTNEHPQTATRTRALLAGVLSLTPTIGGCTHHYGALPKPQENVTKVAMEDPAQRATRQLNELNEAFEVAAKTAMPIELRIGLLERMGQDALEEEERFRSDSAPDTALHKMLVKNWNALQRKIQQGIGMLREYKRHNELPLPIPSRKPKLT